MALTAIILAYTSEVRARLLRLCRPSSALEAMAALVARFS